MLTGLTADVSLCRPIGLHLLSCATSGIPCVCSECKSKGMDHIPPLMVNSHCDGIKMHGRRIIPFRSHTDRVTYPNTSPSGQEKVLFVWLQSRHGHVDMCSDE